MHTQFEIEVQEKIPDITLENVSSVLVKDEYSIFVVKHEGMSLMYGCKGH